MSSEQLKKPFIKKENHFTDLGRIAKKYLYHWPLFLLGLILAFTAAAIYLKTVDPAYEISATILVKDEKKAAPDKSGLQEIDEARTPKSAETEIQILRSKNIITKVINDLQLWVNYSAKDGLVKKDDLYETTPFRFMLAGKGNLLKKQSFEVTIKNANTYEVKNLSGGKQTHRFNELVKSGFGRWVLKPTDFLDQYIGSTVTVSINNPEKVANEYLKELDTHLLDKAAPTIGLFVTDRVPKRGKDFLNYLIKTYNEVSIDEEKRTTKSTIDFIDKRLASLTGELSKAEKQVEGYRSSQGLTDIDSQSKFYLENVQNNDSKLNEVNVQLNIINGIEHYVNSSGSSDAPATIGINDPALNNLIEKLAELQLKREELLATTPEGNPAFEPIDRQIASSKSAIRETIRGIKSSLLSSKRQLDSFNNKFESSIKDIPVQERQYVGMKRQQSIKENLYVYLLQKREELALSYASTFVDARIVDKANVGEIKWPRPMLVFAIALLIGLGLPFIIVFFRQSFNNKITERRDLENAVDVPLLGELSYEDLGKNIIVLDNSRHIISEQFRSLRTNLHYLHDNKKDIGRVTLFTSSTAGEGKSFVSSNLAASLAATDRKTVILEMDLRRPRVLSIFDLNKEHSGISDFLSSDMPLDDIIQPSGLVPTLDVIGSGYIPPNPSELLERERLGDLINGLKERYDDVIIDSPPLHLVTDAMIIARHADVSLYIVRQGHTLKDELDFISEVQHEGKLPRMNIIFNGIKKGKYGYGYAYDNSYYTQSPKPAFNTSLKLFLSRF
ncbi:MAG: polysaccharide biosynthesis tyrosine autokinase [Sphingobacteriaceae bacterium]|jgi:capsular exopolysaccharide synthesis family protein|nr:polysaccharide biosynthesis tyrosine autokinase [Sphingobacteriaceae bacterium]